MCGILVGVDVHDSLLYHADHGRLTHSRLTAWNLGCGFAQNTGQLIVFRFLAGLGGSAAISVRTSQRVQTCPTFRLL